MESSILRISMALRTKGFETPSLKEGWLRHSEKWRGATEMEQTGWLFQATDYRLLELTTPSAPSKGSFAVSS